MVKRLADNDEANRVEFIPLGAGQEVGRSCMLLKYRRVPASSACSWCMHAARHVFSISLCDSCMSSSCRGKSVMLDCGIHPGYSGEHSLPYFDLIDLNEVDVMLITHFHLDHCAALPYVVGNTTFKVWQRTLFTALAFPRVRRYAKMITHVCKRRGRSS